MQVPERVPTVDSPAAVAAVPWDNHQAIQSLLPAHRSPSESLRWKEETWTWSRVDADSLGGRDDRGGAGLFGRVGSDLFIVAHLELAHCGRRRQPPWRTQDDVQDAAAACGQQRRAPRPTTVDRAGGRGRDWPPAAVVAGPEPGFHRTAERWIRRERLRATAAAPQQDANPRREPILVSLQRVMQLCVAKQTSRSPVAGPSRCSLRSAQLPPGLLVGRHLPQRVRRVGQSSVG